MVFLGDFFVLLVGVEGVGEVAVAGWRVVLARFLVCGIILRLSAAVEVVTGEFFGGF